MTTVQLLMIVSNGEDTILNSLKSFEKEVDRMVICINNSTDNTRRIVKDFKKVSLVPVVIFYIEFDGFANTRNNALTLSYNLDFKWTYFIDDSYEYRGPPGALKTELSRYTLNPSIHCIASKILRGTMTYFSKRMFRTTSKLFFHGKIHEVVDCEAQVQLKDSFIEDIGTERQLKRTQERIEYDLSQLEGLEDARSAYFRAGYYIQLFMLGKCSIEEPIKKYKKRIEIGGTFYEEIFMSYIHLGHLLKEAGRMDEAYKAYLSASMVFPARAGECYFIIYLNTGYKHFLEKAYEHRIHGKCVLPLDESLYSNFAVGEIEKCFNGYLSPGSTF